MVKKTQPASAAAAHLKNSIAPYRRQFSEWKNAIDAPFGWYPHDTLSSLNEALALLDGPYDALLDHLRDRPILDAGCGDGATAFLLAQAGFNVVTADSPSFNFNAMQGVHALRRHLEAPVDIRALNFDREAFSVDEDFGMAFALGLLYHLRNPIGFLDGLSRCSSYCLLSTRIAADPVAAGVLTPNAYLVDATELGSDETNYWLFTPRGLDRLYQRTGWRLLRSHVVNEAGPGGDRRMFCLLQSTNVKIWRAAAGVHPPEDHGWRWTARHFHIRLREPAQAGRRLAVKVVVPAQILAALGSLALTVTSDGLQIRSARLDQDGAHTLTLGPFAESAAVDLHFELSNALPPNAADHRELGVILDDLAWE